MFEKSNERVLSRFSGEAFGYRCPRVVGLFKTFVNVFFERVERANPVKNRTEPKRSFFYK